MATSLAAILAWKPVWRLTDELEARQDACGLGILFSGGIRRRCRPAQANRWRRTWGAAAVRRHHQYQFAIPMLTPVDAMSMYRGACRFEGRSAWRYERQRCGNVVADGVDCDGLQVVGIGERSTSRQCRCYRRQRLPLVVRSSLKGWQRYPLMTAIAASPSH